MDTVYGKIIRQPADLAVLNQFQTAAWAFFSHILDGVGPEEREGWFSVCSTGGAIGLRIGLVYEKAVILWMRRAEKVYRARPPIPLSEQTEIESAAVKMWSLAMRTIVPPIARLGLQGRELCLEIEWPSQEVRGFFMHGHKLEPLFYFRIPPQA